jgi:hypothetical protein
MMQELINSKFVTTQEKKRVLSQWKRFLESGLKFQYFTQALYRHLIQRCEFIAHYDRAGFFVAYFLDPEDTMRFLRQFDADAGFNSVEYGMDLWVKDPRYADVNRAMCDILATLKEELYAMLRTQARANDLAKAQALLAKHGLAIQA